MRREKPYFVSGSERLRSLVPRLLCCLALFAALEKIAIAQTPAEAPEVSADEYRVYQAILDNMQFPMDDVHVVIFNRTLKFGCGDYSSGVPLGNNCSFMTLGASTPADVTRVLKSGWGRLPDSMWNDFVRANSATANVQDSFKTSWKHRIDGQGVEKPKDKEWDSSNFTFFFSSVGFDAEKTQAMVFVLLFSYTDGVRTSGDYFRLRLNKKNEWEINGRVRYFEKQPDQSN
jgi:hypothetical protein